MSSLFLAHPIFRRASAENLAIVVARAVRRRAPRGALIFGKGDERNDLLGVLSGVVKISVVGPNGKEAVLNMFREGEVFGEIAALDGHPRTADAVALVDCELLALPRAVLMKIVEEDPGVARACIELLCDRLRHTTDQAESVMTLDVPGRMASTLLRLAEPSADGVRRARITQAQFAQHLGLTREIANRYLGDWRRRGWVRVERGVIAIADIGSLSKLAANDGGALAARER